jgi:hypothetical protein
MLDARLIARALLDRRFCAPGCDVFRQEYTLLLCPEIPLAILDARHILCGCY